MDKTRAAMQQALEALEKTGIEGTWLLHDEAITALREALEQPDEIDWIETNKALAKEIIELQKQAEQRSGSEHMEPVAWRVRGYNQFKTGNPAPWRYVDGADKPTVNKPDCCDFEPLYAAPVRTKDLTDEEIEAIMVEQGDLRTTAFARAVIAKLREKERLK